MALVTGSTQEYLLSYLQWLDADRAGLPDSYRRRLERALQRYGVRGLDRTPELEEAVVWMFRSFRRVGELVPAVTAILERRLRHQSELSHLADAEMRTTARPAGRHPGPPAGGRRPGPRCAVPLLRRAAAGGHRRRGVHPGAARSERAERRIPTAPSGSSASTASSAVRSRCAPSCCGGGAAAATARCAGRCWRSTSRRFYRIRELARLGVHRA